MLYSSRRRIGLAAALALSGLAVVASPIAGASSGATTARANSTDRAFVRQMVPHHQMANEMAEMATKNGKHAKIRRLARRIIEAQSAEIRTMRRIAKRLGVTPAEMPMNGSMSDETMRDLETLGVSMDESGMSMNMGELDGANPFDRTFIDMMIAHHQGAIRMASAERRKGRDAHLRRIARGIIRDQAREIRQLNRWRKVWYGAPSPAGGVPRP